MTHDLVAALEPLIADVRKTMDRCAHPDDVIDAVLAALSAALDPALTERAGEVLEGVTPGPWSSEILMQDGPGGDEWPTDIEVASQSGRHIHGHDLGYNPDVDLEIIANARFIAWCREGVPALLAQNAALRAERDTALGMYLRSSDEGFRQKARAEAAEAERERLEKHIEDTAKDTHKLLVAAEAKMEKLRGKIRDWEARIDAYEWSTNSSLTEDIRAEMRATLTTEERHDG